MASHRFAFVIPMAAMLLAPSAFATQSTNRDPAVLATVDAALSAAQSGDVSKLRDQYAPDCVFIDEFAPFRWTGPNALDAYMASAVQMYQETRHGEVQMTVSPPAYVYVSGDAAYVMEPLSEKATVDGKPYESTGFLTFTLARTGQRWKITSQIWTKAGENINPY